jgi:hypothetical protein
VQFARAVEADGDGEAVFLEEFGVGLGQQGAVRRDREGEGDAALPGEPRRPPRRLLHDPAIDQRLAAEKGERGPAGAGRGLRQQQRDGALRRSQRHVFRPAAEGSLLGIAIDAAEIAFLRDGQ